MALIICPDCLNKLSDTATQCPHCGRKIEPAELKALQSALEANQKSGKTVQIIGTIMILASIPGCISAGNSEGNAGVVWIVLFLVGLVLFNRGRRKQLA